MPLAFFQNDFDLLCSDLNTVRLARAAATSSAVPVMLSATTWNNYGGTCGFQYPAWVRDVTKISLEVLDVSFEAIPDPKERDYFLNLPTSFVLEPEEVDKLREVAGRLLRQSPEYQQIVREMGGTPAK